MEGGGLNSDIYEIKVKGWRFLNGENHIDLEMMKFCLHLFEINKQEVEVALNGKKTCRAPEPS